MVKSSSLQVTELHLKNFRCFDQQTIEIEKPIMLIKGVNGSGKTSLLEALYYACFLRSFRTHSPKELVRFGQDNFFVKIKFNTAAAEHEIRVGFSGNKRLVKVDKKIVCSYKELMTHYRVVSLTEDDLNLIKGGPQLRRSFIDQVVLLNDSNFARHIREFRQVVNNRNSLLTGHKIDQESYAIWTEQLWQKSQVIQQMREQTLHDLAHEVNRLVRIYFDDSFSLSFEYIPKKMKKTYQTCEDFLSENTSLLSEERRFGRSLFGAHLDDFSIIFQNKFSKQFASRGQQKLIVLLLKIAQIHQLTARAGQSVFLLDDFMTDFDQERAAILLATLKDLGSQLIFTSPMKKGALEGHLLDMGAQSTMLTY